MPLISSHISKKDQERFNRKVINGLGIINSQVFRPLSSIMKLKLLNYSYVRFIWFQCMKQ